MTEPPCHTAEGVAWIIGVALMAMAAGFVLGVTAQDHVLNAIIAAAGQ